MIERPKAHGEWEALERNREFKEQNKTKKKPIMNMNKNIII